MADAKQMQLVAAENTLARAAAANQAAWSRGAHEEARQWYQEELAAQREVASLRGLPYAAEIDFPIPWDIGAPSPQLPRSGWWNSNTAWSPGWAARTTMPASVIPWRAGAWADIGPMRYTTRPGSASLIR